MKELTYILMCLPAVIMTVMGIAISSLKKDSTMTRHHFARSFNIKKHSKKIIALFTTTGIMFSLGGIILISNYLAAGIAVMLLSLIVFIICFAALQRKG